MDYTMSKWNICNCNDELHPVSDIHILCKSETERKSVIATLTYEHKQDAYLISAAPDMYEALISAFALIAGLATNPDKSSYVTEAATELQPLIKRALTKAEGKNEIPKA